MQHANEHLPGSTLKAKTLAPWRLENTCSLATTAPRRLEIHQGRACCRDRRWCQWSQR